MKFEKEFLQAAHKHCTYNEAEVSKSSLCGCFYCVQNFKPNEIEEWADSDNVKGKSAICPKCGIDSVIGDYSSFPITDETFLKEMYSYWF